MDNGQLIMVTEANNFQIGTFSNCQIEFTDGIAVYHQGRF